MTNYLHVFRGLPGSRKSTKAHELMAHLASTGKSVIKVERDEIRLEILGSYWTGEHSDELKVTKVQHERIRSGLKLGDVVSSDTNLRDKNVREMLKIAHEVGAKVTYRDLRNADVDQCVYDDRKRERQVGEKVIRGMYERFIKGRNLSEQPTYEPGAAKGKGSGTVPDFTGVAPYVAVNPAAKPVVIFDLDGTLCDHNGRDPYDESKYLQDKAFPNVVAVAWALHKQGFQIDVMTGRWDKYRDVCKEWLDREGVPYTNLHLRPTQGRDDAVKLAMFEEHYRNNDEVAVHFCVDDRDRVVDMYRNVLGIQVLQVAPGDF